ncbi:hypothetical protein O0I10_002785 [Lichtheimia ornata]|uniref:E3 ubiquitin protein ligase n=1 Tax=Lichtheimia ornata TaxID=688661 RepID=A0AAD7XY62_9FUNG|nr:uncharacterized protein O0I10_002785 [Lichtheimia ornata]KAJ8661519.1 hypothetical protein O0I10_002785 [Lichtheimia ornata]
MAAAEDTRRHGYSDEQRPRPPKKRFLASSSSSPSQSIDGDSDDSASDDGGKTLMEPYEDFRRDAIFRQWKEYTRFRSRSQKRKRQAEEHQHSMETIHDVWKSHFNQLRTALSDLVPENYSSTMQESSMAVAADTIMENAPTMSALVKSAKSTECGPVCYTRAFWSKREATANKFAPLLDDSPLKHEYQGAFEKWKSSQQSFDDARGKLDIENNKLLVLREELDLMNRRIAIAENTLRDVQSEFVETEQRIAAKKSAKEQEEAMDIDATNKQQESIKAPMEATKEEESKPNESNTLAQVQQTLDRQLREIEVIKDQRIDLKQQIAQAELDLVDVPESRIYKSPVIRQLYQAREIQRDRSDHLTSLCRKLRRDLEAALAGRRAFLKERDNEQLDHIHNLQRQLRRLDRELNEIRGQRDTLQVIAEECKSTKDTTRKSLPELQLIAESRKSRTSILEVELSLLQQKAAAMTGNRHFYEYVVSLGKEPSLASAEEELASLQDQLNDAKAKYCEKHGLDTRQMLEDELARALEIKRLEERAKDFCTKYGFEVSTNDYDEALRILEQQYQKLEASLIDSRKSLDSLESGAVESMAVIAQASKGSATLDEQNLEQVQNLMQIEEEVTKLHSEKSKYVQAFNNLNKAKDANTLVANALTKQIERELAYIKQLNEREKNMNSHLNVLERELTTSKTALDMYTQKEEELVETLKELKKSMSFSKEKLVEFTKSAMEKIQSIEQDAHERLRVEENSELLRLKLKAINKNDRPAEKELRKEKEAYESLLNCNLCNERYKSHIILRCMHTFCKKCLDELMENGPRRCPKCNETFGVNDVKQFYF